MVRLVKHKSIVILGEKTPFRKRQEHILIYRIIRKKKLYLNGIFTFRSLNSVMACQSDIELFIEDDTMSLIEALKLWGGIRKIALKANIKS